MQTEQVDPGWSLAQWIFPRGNLAYCGLFHTLTPSPSSLGLQQPWNQKDLCEKGSQEFDSSNPHGHT